MKLISLFFLKRLAPLATIADTSLESNKPTSKNNENENKSEFLVGVFF
jgi:hypothetical protein